MRSLRLGIAVAALLAGCLNGCGSDGGEARGERDTDAASGQSDPDQGMDQGMDVVDQTVCRADATAVPDPTAEGFPSAWTFPPETTVYHREDREGAGVILTAVSETPFEEILHFLNNDEVAAGFKITTGETEEDDAEANWTTTGYTGRWAIRKSATCPGETVIQVFAASS